MTMTSAIADRCKMLRESAAWIRTQFVGQVTHEQQSQIEAEAANIGWAADEVERLQNELAEARKGEAFSDRVATHWQTEGHRLERENAQMRAALHRIIHLHDRTDLLEAQSIAESALQSEPGGPTTQSKGSEPVMLKNATPLRFVPDDGSQSVRVDETMEFAAAVLNDEKAFNQMIVGELLKALRQGKNVLVIAPAFEFDSFGLPISRIRIPMPPVKDPRKP